MTFRVEFTPEAEADLDRLFDFLLDRKLLMAPRLLRHFDHETE